MARNRQRAKERQARRKAQQQGAPGDGAPKREQPAPPPEPAPAPPEPAQAPPGDGDGRELAASEEIRLQTGAPPQDVGSSGEVLEYEQDLDEEEGEHFDPAEDHPEEDGPAPTRGPRGHRGGDEAEHKERASSRTVPLSRSWPSCRRVQWPDRQALTTLTGVVLGFVLIAGGYLGLLDAIFSRVIQAIL